MTVPSTRRALGLGLLIIMTGCSNVGNYAKSLGIEDASQIKGAEADYMVALRSFVRAGVLTDKEGQMEYHSEVMRLNEWMWSSPRLEGYRRAAIREEPRLLQYKRQCYWIDTRKDVQCKGQRFISGIGK